MTRDGVLTHLPTGAAGSFAALRPGDPGDDPPRPLPHNPGIERNSFFYDDVMQVLSIAPPFFFFLLRSFEPSFYSCS